MKLEQVLNFGMSPNPNANINFADAKATQAFLANITELGVGQLSVMVMQGAPSEWVKVPIGDVEGTIPETAVLEFYIWLEGIPDNNFTHWHNLKAIHACLTQNPSIVVGLTRFLGQFVGDTYMMGTAFAKNAVTEAVIKAWTDAHGVPETPVEQTEPVIPPIVPTGVVGDWSFVHGRANLGPGSDAYPVGAEVAESRGTFVRMSDWWQLKEN